MRNPEEHIGQELERQRQKIGDHAAVRLAQGGVLFQPGILLRAPLKACPRARGAADRDSGQ